MEDAACSTSSGALHCLTNGRCPSTFPVQLSTRSTNEEFLYLQTFLVHKLDTA